MVGTMKDIKGDMGEMKQTMKKLSAETNLMRKSINQMKTSITVLPIMNGSRKSLMLVN
jgi:hypothetical protein